MPPETPDRLFADRLLTDRLLTERGDHRALGAYVVACAFDARGPAFALGDGTVHFPADSWRALPVHGGAILALAALDEGFVSGGDDGRLCRIAGDASELAAYGSRWVEHVATAPGLIACAVGKAVHLFDLAGASLRSLAHPSSVSGIAFDQRGKRIATSHYNGASLRFIAAKADQPRLLEWKGSHTGIAMHPDAEAVVTAMQENSLHGWRLPDGHHMRMSGYPAKTESMSFTRNGRWLATSGADSIVLWPFFGGGPMGKAPTELAGGDGIQCTQVACHPKQETCAAGFADGLVVLADIASARILPIAAPGRGRVTALAWSRDGARLAFGTDKGFAAVVDLSVRS